MSDRLARAGSALAHRSECGNSIGSTSNQEKVVRIEGGVVTGRPMQK